MSAIGRQRTSALLRFDRLFEPRQPRARGGGVGADPAVVDVLDRYRVEMIPALAAAALGDDEPCILEHLEMLHHRAAVDIGEMDAQRARGQRLVLQIVQYLAPDRRGEGLEGRIELVVN